MKSQLLRVFLWAVLCFATCFFNEAAGASLRARKGHGGGDDDDDGGGMGGALMGLMGGAGGGDSDDDDPNMVGHKKKGDGGGVGAPGSVDVNGLESGLASGGVGGLMKMLTAMRAAQGSSDTHIKKDKHGREMYDFRDLDDSTTTQKPIIMTDAPPTMAPAPMIEVPSLPTISLPGKGGKIQGLAKAQAEARQARLQRKKEERAGMTVWPPAPPAPVPVAAAAVPVVTQVPQVVAAMPGIPGVIAPQVMAPVAGNAGLVQSLAAMRQNMDMLMNQAMGMPAGSAGTPPAPQDNTGALMARIDTMSKSFKNDETKMEQKLDALEGENTGMKFQLAAQAAELQAMESAAKKNKESQGEVWKAIDSKTQVTKETSTSAAVKVKTQVAKKAGASVAAVAKTEATKEKVQVIQVTDAKVVKDESASAAAEVKTKVAEVKTKAKAKAQAKVKQSVVSYATKPWDATFSVHLDGKDGGREESFTVRVHPDWAPEGAKRFQDMLQAGILNDARFFRVVPGFMVQFGIAASPKVAAVWEHKRIDDDRVLRSNTRGMMTFATSGPNTRSTQMFINFANNDFLDKQGFSPFAEVVGGGMKVVSRIQSKYKERPNQAKIQHHGNKYLKKHFPDLSFVGHVAFKLPSSAHKDDDEDEDDSFIQDSARSVVANSALRKSYRYGNVATFYHQKTRKSQ